MHIILVSNYVPDRQESMQRYAEMLRKELHDRSIPVSLLRPTPIFSKLARNAAHGTGKWLGYLDKFLIFPIRLRREIARFPNAVVHICDHSNAMYSRVVRSIPNLVTCHDVLAIRSAVGDFPQNPTKFTGRLLQAWIRNGLRASQRVLCVSNATRRNLLRIEPSLEATAFIAYNPLNYEYKSLPAAEARTIIKRLGACSLDSEERFLFHVGGNYWYKNRSGLLRIYFLYIRQGGRLPLLMAGAPLTGELTELLKESPPGARVISVGSVDNLTLNALYTQAAALVFPSLDEGFGWPVLEALASGCPVVCSDAGPLPEVGGEAAFYFNPRAESEAAAILLSALNSNQAEITRRQQLGFAQVTKISGSAVQAIISNYVAVAKEESHLKSRG